MALAGPHVGMPGVGPQAVAVAGVLGAEHGVLQLVHGHGVIRPGVDDLLLKQEAAVDVHHGLGGFHEPAFQQGQALLFGAALQHLVAQHRLVEDAGGLRQGHGGVDQLIGQAGQAAVVPGVAQLMGQGADVGEASLEIGHDQAAVGEMHRRAEGATGLAVPGIEIDPALFKGVVDEVRHLRGELAHLPEQGFPGFLNRVLL